MKNQIYLSNGLLSEYGLSCGYVERIETKEGYYKELYKEHGIYHVKQNFSSIKENTTRNWTSFEKLTEARKEYNSIKLNYR